MEKKYEFTEETIEVNGRILHRIKAVRDFGHVQAGDLGGFIEKEGNLSQKGRAWVFGDALVHDNALVLGDARVFGDAKVFDYADVCGYADVFGNAEIKRDTDYIVFKNFWSSGRFFTWTRSNNMWKVGCFYGTGKELIKKAYKDSEKSGREYERVVRYVESILADEKKEEQP